PAQAGGRSPAVSQAALWLRVAATRGAVPFRVLWLGGPDSRHAGTVPLPTPTANPPPAPRPAVLAAGLVGLLVVGGLMLARFYSDPAFLPPDDFLQYWAAGRLNATGGNPYD